MRSGSSSQRLLPLFLVSAVAVGFEIALTRYFAIASWSEYGYWVISITMVGFAVSGVVLSLFKDRFVRHGERLLFVAPVLLMLCAVAGFWWTTVVPFNPLEFQNPQQWGAQLGNIGQYYVALFPFYFVTGSYIGLYFLLYQDEIPLIYGADLAGAGAGALFVLMAMFVVHPFYLLAVLLPLLVVAGLYHWPPLSRGKRSAWLALLVLTVCSAEGVLWNFNRAEFNEYKAIYPPLHVQGNRVIEEVKSPRGFFLVLDNFTERLDTDLSNNFRVLGAGAPPLTYGLYGDGNRLTSLPRARTMDTSYLRAALDRFPYELLRAPRVLLVGTRGGFRLGEAVELGASGVDAIEPDETVYEFVRAYARDQAELRDPRVRLAHESAAELASEGTYDLVDIASDFLGQSDIHKYAFTVDAVRNYLRMVNDPGLVSIPVSIREFTVYAVKLVETARRALAASGVERPERHILVYRSTWNARILISKRAFDPEQVQRLRAFCELRSFDTSYFPGIESARVAVWNDLPRVSFTERTVAVSDQPVDALREELLTLLGDRDGSFLKGHFFNLEPSSDDRPFFYAILRLAELPAILDRIALVPREEIGYLINVAVIVQALALAALVLGLPLVRWRHRHPRTGALVKSVAYFAGLGLGFLFLEILLIEKAAFYFSDRTYAFAIVLSGMLVFSGLGSYLSARFLDRPRRGITLAVAGVVVWTVLAAVGLDALLFATLHLSVPLKALILLVVVAPLAVALGFPFPLGLALFRGANSHFLPWAWSLNGAFSVVATPLANLLAVSAGYKLLLAFSLILYSIVYLTFPVARGRNRVG